MTFSPIDAEALYQTLLARLRVDLGAQLAAGGAWSIAGVYSGGAWIAKRLAADLGATEYGVINVGLHRDDYAQKGLHSQAEPTTLPFDVQDRSILLVDDVLATGRSIRAAVNELFDYGRPARVALAVLADRGGRELPIDAAYVGATVTLPADAQLELSQDADGRFSFDIVSSPAQPAA
jgi:pyrimidine operon attenuation protein/uracil phosphoribosyltransferase